MYYIDKQFLGTAEHVYPADCHVHPACLVADGTSLPGTVQSFARIIRKNVKLLPDEIERSLHHCNIPLALAGLSHLVRHEELIDILDEFHQAVTASLNPVSKYIPFYVSNVAVLNSCVPMLFSGDTSDARIDSSGLCQKILYDTASTKTGRMSVVSGPNPLTMQKDFKTHLVSRFRDGRVIEIDYSALEPRTALAVAGSEIATVDDVYADIGLRLGIKDRAIAKQVTISFLYGAAKSTICRVAGISEHILQPKLEDLKDIFMFDDIVGNIKKQLEKTGYFTNHAGRAIFPTSDKPGTLFNNYCQSTAVDVALSGFSSLLNLFDDNGLSTKPLCFIHDAVILDVPKKEFDFVVNNVQRLPIYLGIDFPTKMNVLNK